MIVPHSRLMIDEEDIKTVTRVLSSGHISQGERVKELEREIAKLVGIKYGVAVSSGTSAIHLALTALNVRGPDEVVVPSYVCSSPYMAILHAGARPKIADVVTPDFNIDAKTAKKRTTPRTKAIIVPHMFGTPAELDELLDLGIPIIEDCAQSLGAEYKEHRVGSFGKLSVCSFYATKMITSGEGGMVLTDDREIHDKIVEIREYDKKPLGEVRYNYKMTDIQAALGLSQLKKLDYFIKRRRNIASLYSDRFSQYDVTIPSMHSHKKSVFYRYVIMVDKMQQIQKRAKKEGVICEKPVWEPLHKCFPSIRCPSSDYIHSHALSIPLYPSLTNEQVEYVMRTLEASFERR